MIPYGITASAGEDAAAATPWPASSATLPVGMTITRATTALGFTGASFAAGIYTSHSTGVARYERLASEKVGLLIESAATVLNLQSSALSNAAWTKNNGTAASNAAAGPFGGTTADLFTETTANAQHYFELHTAAGVPTASIVLTLIVKPGLRNRMFVFSAPSTGSGDLSAWFDLVGAGAIENINAGTPASAVVATITALPNGWFKCTLSGILTTTGTGVYFNVSTVTTGFTTVFVGSAASPAIWFQNVTLEAGVVPLSPLETTTATVTRNADVTVQTVAPTAGGFAFALGGKAAASASGNQYFISIDDNSAANIVAVRRSSTGAMILDVTSASSLVASITGGTVADGAEFTCAVSIAANSIGFVVNGVAATRDTSAAMPTGLIRMRYGHDRSNANPAQGHLIFGPDGVEWPAASSDSELIALAASWAGSAPPPPSGGVVAFQADAIVDMIGVNTHFNYLGSVYETGFTAMKARLAEMGVRHIRDQCGEDADTGTKGRWTSLKTDHGITVLLIPRTAGSTPASYFASVNASVAGTCDAVEPKNEQDLTGAGWEEAMETHAEALYADLAATPAVAGLPRLGPSFAYTIDSPDNLAAAWPDSESWIQVGNMHDYCFEWPEGPYGGGYGRTLDFSISEYRQLIPPGAPIWTTECGYHVLGGGVGRAHMTQRACAKYLVRSILFHFLKGKVRFYIYELTDWNGESFGLVSKTNVVREQFTAVKNFIALMADPGPPFTTSPLDYSLTGNLTDIHQLLFQKRNGRHYLLLWQGVVSHSGGTSAGTEGNIEATARALTVVTSTILTTVNVYEPTFGTSTVATHSGVSSFGVNVDDHVLVIEIIPPVGQDEAGIAANYTDDVGIDANPAVLFFDDFESYSVITDLLNNYTNFYQQHNFSIVTAAPNVFNGSKSLQITRPQGVVAEYNLLSKTISPTLDKIHIRYYTKLNATFSFVDGNAVHNGVGVSGNYSGPGSAPNGTDFFLAQIESTEYRGEAQPGYTHAYVYHPEQRSNYGDHWYPDGLVIPGGTQGNFGGAFVPLPLHTVTRDVWYCIELMVKLNTPGSRDGRMAVWIDGVLIADWPNLRFRDVGTLKIDNVEIGLGSPSNDGTADQIWYDHLVIATQYIGPMAP